MKGLLDFGVYVNQRIYFPTVVFNNWALILDDGAAHGLLTAVASEDKLRREGRRTKDIDARDRVEQVAGMRVFDSLQCPFDFPRPKRLLELPCQA